MEVYFEAVKSEKEKPGIPIPINKQFFYGNSLWVCPMLYVCKKGLILDLCRQFDAKEYQEFYTKWGEKADSLEPAVQEQIAYENPMNFECGFTLSVNGKGAKSCGYSGSAWQPYVSEAKDPFIEKAIEEYGLSWDCGWYFYRLSYPFSGQKEKAVKNLSLCITAHKRRVFFAETIKTVVNGAPFDAKLRSPLTEECFTFHVESCKIETLPEKIAKKSFRFPTNYCLLQYDITPETAESERLLVEDVRPSDPPVMEYDLQKEKIASCVTIIGGASGPTSVFLAGTFKNRNKEDGDSWKTAASALTFEPVTEATWKFSFEVAPFEAQDFCLLSEGDAPAGNAAVEIREDLLSNIDKLHTTELGIVRIKKNLSLSTDDVVNWCKTKINLPNAVITRRGKNWYIEIDGCVITVNAHSFTIITAHKKNFPDVPGTFICVGRRHPKYGI